MIGVGRMMRRSRGGGWALTWEGRGDFAIKGRDGWLIPANPQQWGASLHVERRSHHSGAWGRNPNKTKRAHRENTSLILFNFTSPNTYVNNEHKGNTLGSVKTE